MMMMMIYTETHTHTHMYIIKISVMRFVYTKVSKIFSRILIRVSLRGVYHIDEVF